jgi:hypothetical protein
MVEFETRDQKPLIGEELHAIYPKIKGKNHEILGKYRTFVAGT